jgi:hypothetical protein
VIQPILHLHVCANPTPAKPVAAGADYAADSAIEPHHFVADYAVDSTAAAAALTETS